MRAAREAEVAIVVVGTSPELEREAADRTSLSLSGRQDELVSAVAAANPRTIVAVNAGSPVTTPSGTDWDTPPGSWTNSESAPPR